MSQKVIPDAERFFNRHLSWMEFNKRVLDEAHDSSNPLLERVKFLAITASNLDEYVEVRLAALMQQAEETAANNAEKAASRVMRSPMP